MGCTPSNVALLSVLNTELFRPAQPIAAIDASHCSFRPLTLHFKRAALSGTFHIRDITDNNAMQFRTSRRASWRRLKRQKTELLDAKKKRIASFRLEQEPASLKPHYSVTRSKTEVPLFEIHARAKDTTTDLRVAFSDLATGERCSLGMYGSWTHRTAIIWLGQGPNGDRKPVAKLYPPPHNKARKDEFCMSIAANVDTALMALICVVLLDQEHRAQQPL